MSERIDNCLLCDAVTKEQKNKIRQHVDLIMLCDILKVSVNEAENSFNLSFTLCLACDTDIHKIRKSFVEMKRIKNNISKVMKVIKSKLHTSLCNNGKQYKQPKFIEIRHGILFDLSNILGHAEPRDKFSTISNDIKCEQVNYPSFNETSDCENENYDMETDENATVVQFQEIKIAKKSNKIIKSGIAVDSINVTQGIPNDHEKLPLSPTIESSPPSSLPIIASQLYDINNENVDEDSNTGEENERYSKDTNSDADFSPASSSDDQEDGEDEDYKLPKKKKSSAKMQSPIKKQQHYNETSLLKSDSSLAIRRRPRNGENYVPWSRKLHDCPNCGKKLKSPGLLQEHIRMAHTGEKPIKCPYCEESFENNLRKELHIQRSHPEVCPFKCSHCAKGYLRETRLKKHMLAHNNERFECEICHKSFARESNLMIHMKFHDPDRADELSCKICNKVFTLPNNVRMHIETVHKRIYKFICETCGHGSGSSSEYKRHLITHTGEKPFCCEECGQTYPSIDKLRYHKRMHTGERPHVCVLCQKGFVRRSTLMRHLKIHQKANS